MIRSVSAVESCGLAEAAAYGSAQIVGIMTDLHAASVDGLPVALMGIVNY